MIGNPCEFAMSNHKIRIKILMNILKDIDSLWINTWVNGNALDDGLKQCQKVLNGLKSILLKNFKLLNDTTSLIHNMIKLSKMVCNNNNNNNNLFLRLYIWDYLICILYKIYFRNNGMYCSVIRMAMRKKKIMITHRCARMNIVFILLVIAKTDRHEFLGIIYSMILILYIILTGIYQLMYQFMTQNKAKHSNIYIEKNIFKKNVIYLVPTSVLHDVIVFSSIIVILYGLHIINILDIMKCCIFFKNCGNRKVRMRKRKKKCKDKNRCSYNVMCKDEYFILFSMMDNTDRNDIFLNIYLIVLILYIILNGIYPLNCQIMIEIEVKHSNIYIPRYNKKIFEKIIVVFILIIKFVYSLNDGYLCMNTLFICCYTYVDQFKQIKRDNILNIKCVVGVKDTKKEIKTILRALLQAEPATK